jgi:hypothetical protein
VVAWRETSHDENGRGNGATCAATSWGFHQGCRKDRLHGRVEDQGNRDAMLKQADESWKAGTPVA